MIVRDKKNKTMAEVTAEVIAQQTEVADQLRFELVEPEIARADESFTNQLPRIATLADCSRRWGGSLPGEGFRCYMCGYAFKPGDRWRWVCSIPMQVINFIVCEQCDGEDVRERWIQQNEEAKRRFWWFRRPC